MDTTELLRKVRKLEIKSRGLSNRIFSGEYHSAFKGRGMAFSEVREYIPGDDVRAIDWNVTARLDHPYVKIFEEEREMTVMLLVDASASRHFGSSIQSKHDLITELCAVLAFSAIQNKDHIGIIFFTDKIEKFIPPKRGSSHILRIIRELIEFNPSSQKTDIKEALRYLSAVIKKKSTAFLISDFMDEGYEVALKMANKKHDIMALSIFDKREETIPEIGWLNLEDAETRENAWVNTSSATFQKQYLGINKRRKEQVLALFKRAGVDAVQIGTHESYVQPLMRLFKQREGRR